MDEVGLITTVNADRTENSVGARIAWARAKRKLTQAELARRAGVSQSAIASYEAGHRGRPRELVSIAKALDTSVNWLDTGEGDWEAGPRETSEIYEHLLPELLRGSVIAVQRFTPMDRPQLPTWLRAWAPYYVPDFALRLPGAPEPVYVEVKGNHTPAERIEPYLKLAQERPTQFAIWVVDTSKPRLGLDDFLADLRRKFEAADNINRGEEWGSWGGEDQNDRKAPTAVREPAIAYGMSTIKAWDHPDELPEGEFVMVPRLDVHLSAGNGHEQVEIELVKDNPQAFRAEWIRLMRLKPAKLAAMRAAGESMEPTIHDGDSLLVDTSQTDVVDGKVYALWYDGGERVKRLFRVPGGGLRIQSDNPRFPTMELQPNNIEHIRIIGRVVHRSGTGGL